MSVAACGQARISRQILMRFLSPGMGMQADVMQSRDT